MGRGNFEGGKGRPIVKCGDTAVVCAKTAEPIEMPFGLWARMGRRNHVLDQSPEVMRDVTMATNFGMQFAITGFVGNHFGCMIGSDTLFDSRGGFSGSSYPMKTAEIECQRVVAMATNFGTKIAINRLCANDSD